MTLKRTCGNPPQTRRAPDSNPAKPATQPSLDRRSFLTAALGAAAAIPALAQAPQQPISPNATPRDWSNTQNATPVQYPDPDIVALDNRFRRYMVGNTTIKRLYTGTLWSEGPAWNGVGRYLVWSDIPNNVQMRWIEEDGRITTFRNPSGYSNGNTFDFEGRQLSCEHGGRRVVRYEYDGTVTVIADKFEGKRLNSPNDIVVHPDGSIWFTDPPYGINGNYEGFKAAKELKEAVYRVDPKTGQMTKLYDEMDGPNGICFSPDYKKVYICDTGTGREIRVWDVDGKTVRNGKRFVQLAVPGRERLPPPTASAATSMATSGRARGPACRSSPPAANRSASFACRRIAPTSASAEPRAIASSWPPASPSMSCTCSPPARTSPECV